MNTSDLVPLLERVAQAPVPEIEDLVLLLSLDAVPQMERLYAFADEQRRCFWGEGILLRGIIEFSNYCRNSCAYCGLSCRHTALTRYRMSDEEIIGGVERLAAAGLRTVVLQSGEDDQLDPLWLARVIRRIKERFELAVTLCVGEHPQSFYRLWRQAGADRYLLKIETSDRRLYETLHPGMSFQRRLRCLDELSGLGYQTGSGIIIGLKGQTLESIARDILFFKERRFDMIGIGPFIPHRATPLGAEAAGNLALTLKALALTRIVVKRAHLPATTALGSLQRDYRLEGLKAGANVVMPNFTPLPYRKLYEIYPGKKCIDEGQGACVGCMEALAATLGRFIDYGRGDAFGSIDADNRSKEDLCTRPPQATGSI